MAEEWLVLLGALAAGFALGALTIFLATLRRKPRPEPEIVRLEPVLDDEGPFEDHFGVAHAPRSPAPAAAPAPRAPPTLPEGSPLVPTEWAQRAQDGVALPAGHVRGVCSGCGTPLSVGPRRPLRIACPECGRTRLLA